MKPKFIVAGVVVIIAIAALIFAYTQMRQEVIADDLADQPVSAPSRVETDTNGQTIVSLDPKTQQLIGLQITTLTGTTLPQEIEAYGHVLDSAALVSLYGNAVAAQASLEASQSEYDRLEKLNEQENVSAHSLETGESDMKRDKGLYTAAQMQLIAGASKWVAEQPSRFFESLGRQENVLVRLDLPAGETPSNMPASAHIILPGSGQPVTGNFAGNAAATDPQVQGAGFIFNITNAPAALTPGLAVKGFLLMPDAPVQGVVVSDDAVIRSGGGTWVYVQNNETNFVRVKIVLDRPVDNGWFLTNGVSAGDKIVATGAQVLNSEEHKMEIKMED
jgi:hypothetical protein